MKADLYGANLNGADLRGANSQALILGRSYVLDASFLAGADLSDADLRGRCGNSVWKSHFYSDRANLSGVDFPDAKLDACRSPRCRSSRRQSWWCRFHRNYPRLREDFSPTDLFDTAIIGTVAFFTEGFSIRETGASLSFPSRRTLLLAENLTQEHGKAGGIVAENRQKRARPKNRAGHPSSAPPSTSSAGSSHGGVGRHSVDEEGWGMHAKRLQEHLRREAGGLADLGKRGRMTRRRAPAACKALANSGTSSLRERAGEPRTGAEHHPVGVVDGLNCTPGTLADLAGGAKSPPHAGSERARYLTAYGAGYFAIEHDLGLNVQRHRRHRQNPAVCAKQPPDPLQRPYGILHGFPERQRSRDCRPRGRADSRSLLNRCCRTRCPGPTPLMVSAQCGERHPQVKFGGSTPSSRLRRPLEPPSSATVTIAVNSAVILRNTNRDACEVHDRLPERRL